MPHALLWREWLENHVALVIAIHADAWVVRSTHNVSAAYCLQLGYQHSDGLESLFAKAPLRCELMRSENTLVYFIE